MIKLNLEANTEEEKLIKEHLENTASEILAEKINNGTKIIKDDKTLLNKKDLNGFLNVLLLIFLLLYLLQDLI